MNKVILMGRMTRDPDVRYSQGQDQQCVARFTLAVNSNQKKQEGKKEADFISCVAFGKKAEFCEKWTRQGTKIVISGRIATGSYTNRDGVKVYTTDIIVEEIEFAESKAAAGNGNNQGQQAAPGRTYSDAGDGFMNIPDGIDEELPFS